MPPLLPWNNQVKLILSDVDETVADLYVPAEPDMIAQLQTLLESGVAIFFITGQGLKSVQWRILDALPPAVRRHILVGHCSGAEVFGHDQNGLLRKSPFYSLYDSTLDSDQKRLWRKLVEQLIAEFKLKTLPTMPIAEFVRLSMGDPLTVMVEDRGPQITLEVVNGYDLSPEQEQTLEASVPLTHGHLDLRIPLLERADELWLQHNMPIVSKLGGVFAVDFVTKGVSKTTAASHALQSADILSSIGLSAQDLDNPSHLEIWGDKFSVLRGGTDRHMSEAVDASVRSIDFRLENPDEFLPGYNTQLWNGSQHLHHGLLEYLKLK